MFTCATAHAETSTRVMHHVRRAPVFSQAPPPQLHSNELLCSTQARRKSKATTTTMRPLRRLAVLLVLVLLPAVAWALAPPRFPGPQPRARQGANGVGGYEYETRYFRQRLDHFSFPGVGDEDEAAAFFQQRYLVGRGGGWAGPGGPIFFYCGNEGDIAWFAANSGLVWEAAPRFAALVVFAEAIILPPPLVSFSSSASVSFFSCFSYSP